MALEMKKVFFASVLITALGMMFVVASLVLQMLPLVLEPEVGATISLLSTIYLFLLYPLFFVLYFWAGMRGAKRYGLDAINSGIVTAFSSFIVGAFELIAITIITAVVLAKGTGAVGFQTPEIVVTNVVFGDIMGYRGIGLSALCGLGLVLLNSAINFVIGGLGAILALSFAKRSE